MRKVSVVLVLIFILSFSMFVSAEEDLIELYVGESIPLDTKVVSGEIIKDESDIVWSYSEDGICSISSSDIVTGKKAGRVTVTGNLNQGSKILEVKFDVLVKNTVKNVEVTTPDQTLRVGETFGITYNINPVELLPVKMNSGIKFKSTDNEVATVSSSGLVTVVGIGEAIIFVESTEAGKRDYLKVASFATVDKVSIDQKSETIYVGESRLLTVTYTPIVGKEIYLKESEWNSFDSSTITVNNEGLIKGVKVGDAAIRATSKDNDKVSTVRVNVISGVKDVEITENIVELTKDYTTHELTAVITPVAGLAEPFEKGLIWKSSDSSICSISSSGKITAKKTGTVSITVETKDGNLKDYMSVKVSLPVVSKSDPNVKVKDIEFNMDNTKVKVGERIELDFTVTPDNANRDSIKFNVRTSSYGRIDKEGDLFYFTALKKGGMFIDATADGNTYDETLVFADSMLKGFEIDETIFEEEYGQNVLYIGQKIQLKPDFQMAIGDYPLLDEVKYTSSDTKYLKIVDGDYLEAVSLGNSIIKGVTSDNGYEDSVSVKVISNIKELKAEKSARIGIGMGYTPTVNFIPVDNQLYDLTEVIKTDYDIKIDKLRISAELIENEIEYTKQRKAELDKLIDERSGDLNANLAELQECHQRLFDYETVFEKKSGDFCDISDLGRDLTDRSYNNLKVAEIKSNALFAYIVSEIDLKVISKDPEVYTTITVSVEDNATSIVIFDENGDIITASVEHILNHFTDEVLFQNNPSSWATESITLANSKGLLVKEVIDDYQASITREEFVTLVMNFYDVVLGFPESEAAQDVFNDTNNPTILRAYDLGIISGRGPGVFAPYDNVTREELCVILDKAMKIMNRELITKTTYKNFTDKGEISSWASDAVEKMTNQYDILSGVGGDVFSPKGNTTKEQAIIVIRKMFDGLK